MDEECRAQIAFRDHKTHNESSRSPRHFHAKFVPGDNDSRLNGRFSVRRIRPLDTIDGLRLPSPRLILFGPTLIWDRLKFCHGDFLNIYSRAKRRPFKGTIVRPLRNMTAAFPFSRLTPGCSEFSLPSSLSHLKPLEHPCPHDRVNRFSLFLSLFFSLTFAFLLWFTFKCRNSDSLHCKGLIPHKQDQNRILFNLCWNRFKYLQIFVFKQFKLNESSVSLYKRSGKASDKKVKLSSNFLY